MCQFISDSHYFKIGEFQGVAKTSGRFARSNAFMGISLYPAPGYFKEPWFMIHLCQGHYQHIKQGVSPRQKQNIRCIESLFKYGMRPGMLAVIYRNNFLLYRNRVEGASITIGELPI
jgi:hypothetical protein